MLTVSVVSYVASNEGEYEKQYYAHFTDKAKQPESVIINYDAKDLLGYGDIDVTLQVNCANGTIRYASGNLSDHLYLNEFNTPEQIERAYFNHMKDEFNNDATTEELAKMNSDYYGTQLQKACN